jgi:hypothetical protein
MDKERIWELYRFGFDHRDYCLMFPGVSMEELRRVIVEAAATADFWPVAPDWRFPCSTCGGQGMKIQDDGCILYADCATLEWLEV